MMRDIETAVAQAGAFDEIAGHGVECRLEVSLTAAAPFSVVTDFLARRRSFASKSVIFS